MAGFLRLVIFNFFLQGIPDSFLITKLIVVKAAYLAPFID